MSQPNRLPQPATLLQLLPSSEEEPTVVHQVSPELLAELRRDDPYQLPESGVLPSMRSRLESFADEEVTRIYEPEPREQASGRAGPPASAVHSSSLAEWESDPFGQRRSRNTMLTVLVLVASTSATGLFWMLAQSY